MRDYTFIALVTILIAGVSFGLVSLNLRFRGGEDFLVAWTALRSYYLDRIEPYSGEVVPQVQLLLEQNKIVPSGKPLIPDVPFHLLVLFSPLAFVSNPILAKAVWTLILEIALGASSILILRLHGYKKFDLLGIGILFFGCLNYYSIEGLVDAGVTLLLLLIYIAILIANENGADEIAGALIALTLTQWEVGFLWLLVILQRLYLDRRSRVFTTFLMTTIVLFTISYFIYPDWLLSYFRALVNIHRTQYGLSSLTILQDVFPARGELVGLTLTVGLVLVLMGELVNARRSDSKYTLWLLSLGLSVTPLLGFQTKASNMSVLLIPLTLVLVVTYRRWGRLHRRLMFLLLGVLFILPWWLFLSAGLENNSTIERILFFYYPLIAIIGLYWNRWWILNPPLTWLDELST